MFQNTSKFSATSGCQVKDVFTSPVPCSNLRPRGCSQQDSFLWLSGHVAIPLKLRSLFSEKWLDIQDLTNRGSPTRVPQATCGPRGHFVWPAMLFENFQMINI